MTLPMETMSQIEQLSEDKINIVISVVNQLTKTPQEVLYELRAEGLKNPMTEDEIDDFVKQVRSERRAAGH